LSLPSSGDLRALRSFPTRRSSDLAEGERGGQVDDEPVRPRIPPRGVAMAGHVTSWSGWASGSGCAGVCCWGARWWWTDRPSATRSEEHTSELQSLTNLVCRLLLEQ